MVNLWGFDGDNAEVVVDIFIGVDISHRLILLLNLFFWVEDDIKVFGKFNLDFIFGKISN